jgi:transposase
VGECGVQLQPLVDALRRNCSSAVLHADETPVAMLKPGNGKTHRAYLWTYCTTRYDPIKAVVFDFAEGRGGQHVRGFLGLPERRHQGRLARQARVRRLQRLQGLLRAGRDRGGCMAHARRKFHELWANHGSQVGERGAEVLRAEMYDRSSARCRS